MQQHSSVPLSLSTDDILTRGVLWFRDLGRYPVLPSLVSAELSREAC